MRYAGVRTEENRLTAQDCPKQKLIVRILEGKAICLIFIAMRCAWKQMAEIGDTYDPMKTSTHRTYNDIAVTVYEPDTKTCVPAIILCNGFCCIQELVLPRFAEAFVRAGYAAATFDYRGFGASGGERGRLVPFMQVDDIATVIAFVRQLPGIDRRRLGLWGTSLGGCHVLAAAANDPSIKVVVSQLGFADGEQVVTRHMTKTEKQALMATLERMHEKKQNTGREMFVAITKVLTDKQSKAFFDENLARYPAMDIKIPFLTVREMVHYRPMEHAARVTCPVFVAVAGEDEVNPACQGIVLFEAVPAIARKLHIEEDAGHYGMCSRPHFDNCINKQIDWFRDHL